MPEPIFLDYDRPALDAQYNNRLKVPHFPEYIERWRRESAAARSRLDCRADVAFGPSAAERLDVFPAAGGRSGGAGSPVLVFIHGGYWMMLDKSDADYVAAGFVPQGIATVVINYALMPAVSMDELVAQCRRAVAWTLRHAGSFGGDPARVAVCGHSAGGHLTAMVAATDWADPASYGAAEAPPTRPIGGYSLSGLHDLEPIRLCYLNDTLGLSPIDAARNSPMRLAPPPDGCWMLAVGGDEGPEYLRQTFGLAQAWGSHGRRQVAAQVLKQTDHFMIADCLDDPAAPLTAAIAHDLHSRR
ncbi:MAG TPA: alpha/beta hydrolase [Burkholderiaceae bacterium]|nr:alpha/beta hydrolase [Burkholderiaceae bacterium]